MKKILIKSIMNYNNGKSNDSSLRDIDEQCIISFKRFDLQTGLWISFKANGFNYEYGNGGNYRGSNIMIDKFFRENKQFTDYVRIED